MLTSAVAFVSLLNVFISSTSAESYYYGGASPKIIYDVPNVYSGLVHPPAIYTRHGNLIKYDGVDRDQKLVGLGLHGTEIIRDVGELARKKSDSKTGGHFVAKDGEGVHNYIQGDEGLRRVHGNQAITGGQSAYDAAAKGGYGVSGSKGHKKGHQTTGFQKSYHKDESGKNVKYIDEDHDVSHEDFGRTQHNAHMGKAWDANGARQDEGVYKNKLEHRSGAQGILRDRSSHDMVDGAHDANGYYYNQDLAYRRRQDLSKDNQMAKIGLGGIRNTNGGAVYHGELW